LTAVWQNDLHRRSSQFAAVAVLIFLLCLVGTVGFGLTSTASLLRGFPIVPRPNYVPAMDPIRAADGGIPIAPASSNPAPVATVRALEVLRDSVRVLLEGRPIRTVRIASDSLQAIVAAVHDPRWIAEPHRGFFTVTTPLIFMPGLRVRDVSPFVRSIELVNGHGAFLGFNRDVVSLEGVNVTSSGASRSPPLDPRFRPFVEFEGSSVNLVHSRFTDLGWDWNASYGVSLMEHTTGSILTSTFEDDFIGTYVDHSRNLTLRANRFIHNDLYGLDPHSFSSHLRIIDNVAEFNAAHGIVFSNHVTDSEVVENLTAFNGENGIMMDDLSNHNLIEKNNSVHNQGDGIVLSSSSNNAIMGNLISFDRIGINLYGSLQSEPAIARNVISHDVLPSQGISLVIATNATSDNNSERSVPPPGWHVLINLGLWPIFVLLGLTACAFRVGERRRLPPRTHTRPGRAAG